MFSRISACPTHPQVVWAACAGLAAPWTAPICIRIHSWRCNTTAQHTPQKPTGTRTRAYGEGAPKHHARETRGRSINISNGAAPQRPATRTTAQPRGGTGREAGVLWLLVSVLSFNEGAGCAGRKSPRAPLQLRTTLAARCRRQCIKRNSHTQRFPMGANLNTRGNLEGQPWNGG